MVEADLKDLIAATIAGDAWGLITGATTLAKAGRYGKQAREVAIKILGRAAGYGKNIANFTETYPDSATDLVRNLNRNVKNVTVGPGSISSTYPLGNSDEVLARIEQYWLWSVQYVGEKDTVTAFTRASEDLSGGGETFYQISEALIVAAYTLGPGS